MPPSSTSGARRVGRRRGVPSVPDDVGDVRLLPLDLTDAAACRDALAGLHVTHLVYAALQEGPGLLPGWFDEDLMQRNAAMLRNLLDALDLASLQHVSLLQGTKAYGVHHPDIGADRAPLPLRERAPRVEHRNFYWLQEDELPGPPGGRRLDDDDPAPDRRLRRHGPRQHEPAPGDRRPRCPATVRRRAVALPGHREPPHAPRGRRRRSRRAGVAVGRDVTTGRRRDLQPHQRRRVLLGHGLAGDRLHLRARGGRGPPRSRSPPTSRDATPSGLRSSSATTSMRRRRSRASSVPTRSSTPTW